MAQMFDVCHPRVTRFLARWRGMRLGSEYRNQLGLLAGLAPKQHGVVAMWQLLDLGFSRWAVHRLVEKAHLHCLHRGVYAVGHTKLTARGRWMAAVLACGPEAVLSHRAAAALWDMRGIPSGEIDVTAPKSHVRDGVRSHVSDLPHEERTIIDAIPVTSLYRTLLDEAPKLSPQRLRSRLEELERRELLDTRSLDALFARNPARAGGKKLKAAIAELTDMPQWTQSRGERDLLELARAAGLPEPSANVYVAGELVDFVWWRQRLIVEIDHYGTHGSKRAFEDDRLRDTKLQRAGFRVMRVTYERLEQDPDGILADIRALLAEPAPIGSAPP